MNIREIKENIINNGLDLSGYGTNNHLELLTNYIEGRLETKKNLLVFQGVDNPQLETYRNKLFKIINPTLARYDHQIIFCTEHQEIEILNIDDVFTLTNHGLICRSAYESDYLTCDVCEEVNPSSDCRSCDSRDYTYCETCFDARVRYCNDCDTNYDENDGCQCEEEPNNLLHHRTKNKLYSHGKENAILFYGNETELQAYRDQSRYDIVEKFNECFNYDGFENILCKHDGSLDTDKGFEMSSTNCSFEYHKETFWNDFFELNPAQYCKGYNGYQCGIHWHFNRNVFTENQLRRLNCFYNHPKNKNLIVDIAGREGYQYCKFVPSITFDDPIRTIGDDFKYRVINFSNEHTIEIRIFRSNLKKISFFRYLEFVHSVNEWIRSSDQDNAENITWEYYFDWLLKNISRKFENLFFFLDDRKHFDHLENIEEWNYVYTNFKTLITDFRNNNQEQIELESEEI